MEWICKMFGHSWKCYMGFTSVCRWCGIDYTTYYHSLSKKDRTKIDRENKQVLKEGTKNESKTICETS